MKIFYDGVIFLYQWKGGVNRIFEEITQRLPQIDKNIEIYLHRFPNSFNRSFIGREYFMLPKVGKILRFVDGLILSRKIRVCKPDICHTTYYRIPTVDKVKKVVTVYDTVQEKFLQRVGKVKKILAAKRECIENADKIIAISENTKRDIVEIYGLEPKRISIVHLAAGDIFEPAADEEIRQLKNKYGINRPFILYVGQRQGYKNYLTLLRAFAKWNKNKDYELICIGGKDWDEVEAEIIKSECIKGRVRRFSLIDDKELKAFYSSASVFVCPSLYEGFGIPILEAMACGASVVATNCSSIPEVAGDAALYIDPLSMNEIILAIDKITSDNAFSNTLKIAGLKRSKEFNWNKVAQETHQVYKSIL